jgi:hypothetical protein
MIPSAARCGDGSTRSRRTSCGVITARARSRNADARAAARSGVLVEGHDRRVAEQIDARVMASRLAVVLE